MIYTGKEKKPNFYFFALQVVQYHVAAGGGVLDTGVGPPDLTPTPLTPFTPPALPPPPPPPPLPLPPPPPPNPPTACVVIMNDPLGAPGSRKN